MDHGDPTRAHAPDRRALLRGTLAASAALSMPVLASGASAAPAHLLRRSAPAAKWGVQAGDVTSSSGLVWTRADRPARMLVETAPTEAFRNPRRWHGPLLGPETDFTGRVAVHGLPPGEQIHYRVTLLDPDDGRRAGEPERGTFRTAPRQQHAGVRFVWSGDLAGQGWGINPDRGGYRIFEEMRRLDPDFYLNSGDTIYADSPIEASVPLPDGSTWRNVTTEEKSKVAETLAEFRGNFRYNLLDAHLRRFNAQVPTVAQWDDHEVLNNWYPGEILDDDRYTEKDVDTLAARSLRAFSEYLPVTTLPPRDEDGRVYRVVHHGPLLDVFVLDMRSHRNANSPGRQPEDRQGILGAAQLKWLKRALSRSRATWKVIASDMPISLVVPDGETDVEAVAQGDPGAPLGRELQLAELLRHIKHDGITGTVWFTTDVHHTAAHRYDPDRAAFGDFTPFWEFVSGPLNAGGFPALKLDATFGPVQRFLKAPEKANTPPSEGGQYFGQVDIDGTTREMTVRLREQGGAVLFTQTLHPGSA
ncbi:alkaline phosphatase D family protein [Streptomyces xiaopingdaonensis]|uniref:alkaline phosphatase D family protein n=1 Tax=Streptomyces xiaopingdaonensis TaxID=1565415 RepID=UPI000307C665|nr:alkaline phosphatase D family protein [Streptomyces xiaopingdaonensis]